MKEQVPQNCWEFWNCPEDTKTRCPAFPSAGKKCWEVASSLDKEGCSKVKGRGVLFCVNQCTWFKEMNPHQEI